MFIWELPAFASAVVSEEFKFSTADNRDGDTYRLRSDWILFCKFSKADDRAVWVLADNWPELAFAWVKTKETMDWAVCRKALMLFIKLFYFQYFER